MEKDSYIQYGFYTLEGQLFNTVDAMYRWGIENDYTAQEIKESALKTINEYFEKVK